MKTRRVLLPIGIILFGILLIAVLGSLRKKPEKEFSPIKYPAVEVSKFPVKSEIIKITGSGVVEPELSVSLIPQVAGTIIEVTERMKVGNRFYKGDLLFKIDATDYKLHLENAKAAMLQQEVLYKTEERNQKIAQIEWNEYQKLNPSAKPDSLALRIPQLKLAKANLDAAIANHKLAELNLQRTNITAPFDGVSISKTVDLGQYVTPGLAIGQVFGTAKAQLIIPLKNGDLAWLGSGSGAKVEIFNTIANANYLGKVLRRELSLDPASRMTNLIVEIDDPLNQEIPLTFGTYVEAKVHGKEFDKVVSIPRNLLLNNEEILIVRDDKIIFQPVDVLRIDDDEVLLEGGISENDLVVTSRLDIATQDMKVKIKDR